MTDTLTYLTNRLTKINSLYKFIDTTLNLQHTPISVTLITPDLAPNINTTYSPNLYLIELDGIPDLLQTLDTTNPNDIIFNSDTYITHYPSIDSFILSYIDYITDIYIPDNQ